MDTTYYIMSSIWLAGWWDYVIMPLLFCTVVLWTLAMFGQEGEVRRSPQREAAIASGHNDRKTVFENPILRPIMWILLSMATRMSIPRGKAWMKKNLVAAGSPNYYTPEEYIAVSLLMGLFFGLVGGIFQLSVTSTFGFSTFLLGALVGAALSIYQVSEKASKRMLLITKSLPYAMDLISLAMGAGATFTEAVGAIVRNDEDDPLDMELKALLSEIELGTTRREALQNMANRVPLESMQGLVASVMQAEELGTPISNVLHDQATLLRERRSMRAEEKAASASVQILVPCLFLVMACIIYVFGPFIIRVVRGGLF